MLDFILKVDALIKVAKNRVKLKQVEAYEKLQQKENLRRMKKGQSMTDADGVEDANEKSMKKLKKEVAENRFKLFLRWLLSSIIGFFESLPIFLTLFMSVICIVVVIGVILMIIAMITAIQSAINGTNDKPTLMPPPTTGEGSTTTPTGGAEWSLEELATRGGLLTDYEKNLYRMIMLCRQTADGSLTGIKLGDNADASTIFLVGLSSIETSMKFYMDLPDSNNILEIPSDKTENDKGYGVCGLHYTDVLTSYYKADAVAKIKSMYQPKTAPKYEIRYYPYAVPMSSKHLLDKMNELVYIPVTQKKIEAVMTDFGITENRDELKTIIEWCLGQAQYHGATKSEHEAYITFLCAMWVASSDTPDGRQMTNYTYKNAGYDESGIRHTYTGIYHNTKHTGKTYNQIIQVGNPSNLTFCPQCKSRIALNGVELNKPMWGFLWDKFGNSSDAKIKSRMGEMWDEIATICSYTSGAKDRVLNFHYGINAYIQGSTIMKNISGKLTGDPLGGGNGGIVEGDFKTTPGKSQGVWNGKSAEYHIDKYTAKNSNMKSYMDGLKATFGTAKNTKQDSTVAGEVWKKAKYAVPFYGQGSRFGETYGTLKWYPTGDSYNVSGCMVYAHAYAASAMTGRLINPPEMGAMMITQGCLSGLGVHGSQMPTVYAMLGITAKVLPDFNGKNWTSNWSQVDQCLDKGGVAVVRATGSPYASGSNHYVVITGKTTDSNGKKMYSMYSSTSIPHTNSLHSEATLKANLHREVTLVWK